MPTILLVKLGPHGSEMVKGGIRELRKRDWRYENNYIRIMGLRNDGRSETKDKRWGNLGDYLEYLW